ncbi:hypothetical protein LZK73_05160 [Neorhizobium galegae]|nr:hypothetical protein LZK73_05160 [Neorhizobium galegae]
MGMRGLRRFGHLAMVVMLGAILHDLRAMFGRHRDIRHANGRHGPVEEPGKEHHDGGKA